MAAAGPAPIATEALERIKALYVVEAEIRGMTADQRRAGRQARSQPILEAMEPWLRAKLQTVSQKGKLADAIRYTLARWEGLTRFIDNGMIEIDSNTVERSIRPIALTRKNALFAGSDAGAEHWAATASLVETCRLNGVDPEAFSPPPSNASSKDIRKAVSANSCPGHVQDPSPLHGPHSWTSPRRHGRRLLFPP